jgi:hypothetical protein
MLGVASTARTRRLFLASLGGVYLVAFASLGIQVHGLVGESGISPNETFFEGLEGRDIGVFVLPSVCRLAAGCSDAALSGLIALGALSALALISGALPLLAAFLCWGIYLSLFYAAQPFLGFQWDLLLLEAGFLAMFLAPARVMSPRSDAWAASPSKAMWLCMRWLLFRVVFASGVVKLTSGDGTWLELGAMAHHFETQPLPVVISWWAHQLPASLLAAMTAGTLLLEVLVPFCYWGPRRLRRWAGVVTVLFMLAIAATGHYGFFNLLTIVLCLSLFDDRDLPARQMSSFEAASLPEPSRASRAGALLRNGVAIWVVIASLTPLAGAFRVNLQDTFIGTAHDLQGGLRAVNGYGLFARMTTERPEIIIEGSIEGREWRSYRFRWKPGDPQRAPAFLALHMPRLDWQMWFAALRAPRVEAWLVSFCARILEGEPEVLALLESDPFSGRAPAFLRVTLYDYHFTSGSERDASGSWWKRKELGRLLELRASDLRARGE